MYYVSLAWRYNQSLDWVFEGVVIDVHPLEYLLESRKDLYRSVHALWWTEIAKDVYEKFKDDF